MPQEDSDRIENLKQSLYSREAPETKVRRKMRFLQTDTSVKTDWEHPQEESVTPTNLLGDQPPPPSHMHFLNKVLIASAAFCLLAVGIGAFIFFRGSNLISADNISVEISGPVSVPAGTPVALAIKVSNNNSVELVGADLEVNFPAGTVKPDDSTTYLDFHKEVLGDIAPGTSVSKIVQATIFGEQNQQKTVSVTVSYKVAGSSSVFTKKQSYDILLSSSPVVVTVSSLKETSSGESFDMKVTIKSNSENVVRNILLKASYPFGYSYKTSFPDPATTDGTVWDIGDIPPGGTRTVTVTGALTGENTELRAFRFAIGVRRPEDPLAIGAALMEAVQEVSIQKSFISLGVVVNSDQSSTDYVAQYDRSQNISVRWINNLPDSLTNVEIIARLSGSAYDKTKVLVPGGYFRSETNEIVWNRQTNSELASVAAGGSGSLNFALVPTNKGSASSPTLNPVVTIAARAAADRVSSSNVPNSTAEVVRNIKISPSVSFSGRVVRDQGPFPNSGPIPPRAEESTTYTVIWTVANTPDSVGGATVTATLPPYVSWLDKTSPSGEISYDNNSGTVTWNIGTVNDPTKSSSGRREVAFQVAVTPSVTHINQAPVILNRAVFSATDSWSGATVTANQGNLTTSFSTDPAFRNGDDQVRAKQ